MINQIAFYITEKDKIPVLDWIVKNNYNDDDMLLEISETGGMYVVIFNLVREFKFKEKWIK